MKIRIGSFAALILAVLVLTGATIWEGAASVSAGTELPRHGYYAATNSFPRNTVVDVTNLENGKTIRVIVAAGLDNQGLLAVLSRDAADSIGLAPQSIGRIKLIQPSDPIAFSRFTDGFTASGDPDFDPRAQLAEGLNQPLIRDLDEPEAYTPPAEAENHVIDTEAAALADEAALADFPEYYTPPEQLAFDESIDTEPDLVWANPVIIDAAPENTDDSIPDETIDWDIVEYADAEPENSDLLSDTVIETTDGVVVTETIVGEADYALVPAEERPPASSNVEWPDETEIVDLPPPVNEVPASPNEAYFVEAVDAAALQPAVEEIEEIKMSPVQSPGGRFSVPTIGNLERGKYYLQLGAFSKADNVESQIDRIGRVYPIVVQDGGSSDKPVYRVLVGPVNLGESGALLERFKGSGFNDAFVRSGG
jgi:cell division septation protein DedD